MSKEILEKRLNLGAKLITDSIVEHLNGRNIRFREITWKNGKEYYVVSVKSEFGTKFARFSSTSLLEQDSQMTQEVNKFLILSLVEKLELLKSKNLG